MCARPGFPRAALFRDGATPYEEVGGWSCGRHRAWAAGSLQPHAAGSLAAPTGLNNRAPNRAGRSLGCRCCVALPPFLSPPDHRHHAATLLDLLLLPQSDGNPGRDVSPAPWDRAGRRRRSNSREGTAPPGHGGRKSRLEGVAEVKQPPCRAGYCWGRE